MVGMRRHESPTGVAKRAVGFAESLVTGVSRPLTNDEHWKLYYFEDHAAECDDCFRPYLVHKDNRQLCNHGHELAIDVAELLFKLSADGEVYARSKIDGQEVRVEVPASYKNTIGLFKALQRSNHAFLKKQSSYDRHYPIQPRISLPRVRIDEAIPRPSSGYKTRVAQPAPLPLPRKKSTKHHSHSKGKRGSVYEDDLFDMEEAAKRERQTRYRFEVREPTFPRRNYP
jgi:hypothetical protein